MSHSSCCVVNCKNTDRNSKCNFYRLWLEFSNNPAKWSAFRAQDYGFTRFVAHNRTHIYLEQISVDLKGEVIDSMWLVKNKPSFNTP